MNETQEILRRIDRAFYCLLAAIGAFALLNMITLAEMAYHR